MWIMSVVSQRQRLKLRDVVIVLEKHLEKRSRWVVCCTKHVCQRLLFDFCTEIQHWFFPNSVIFCLNLRRHPFVTDLCIGWKHKFRKPSYGSFFKGNGQQSVLAFSIKRCCERKVKMCSNDWGRRKMEDGGRRRRRERRLARWREGERECAA